LEDKDEQKGKKEQEGMTCLISLNFSSASGAGFLSGWYYGRVNEDGSEAESQKSDDLERKDGPSWRLCGTPS
jgi:hypothetical protein